MALQVTSEISRHILKSPLIDLRNGDVSYVFNDFYHYFVPAMDAFDSFYKKYNLIVLKGNREYQNFPDDSSKEINFCNMEHAIGLSSFGFKKTDERLFLETMLNRVILSSTNNDRISPNDENGIIRIIDYWDNFKRLESTDYDFINRMLLKYKDVDNIYTQRIMFKLSKIILEKAFSHKAKLLIYRPSINERKEDMLDDLVYFIDNIDNDRIKKILFNSSDFNNPHIDIQSDKFDEKSLVIGYFSNYLSSKYDINESEKGLSINIGELIDEAKERYFDYYTDAVINNMMMRKPKNIKKKINEIINHKDDSIENSTVFNKIIDDYINREKLSILNKNNIRSFLSKLDDPNLDINNMIIINNLSKEVTNNIASNEEELKLCEDELNQLQDEYKELIIKYKNNENIDDNYLKDRIATMIRNKRNTENYDELEKQIIEIHNRINNLTSKIESLKDYGLDLITFQEKSNNYNSKVKEKIISLLRDYTNNKEVNNDDYLVIQDIVTELLRDNYKEIVIRELKYKKNVSNTPCEIRFLDDLDSNITDDLKLNIVNHKNKMKEVFEGLYDEFDNDYEKALQLVSDVADRFTLNAALYLKNHITLDSMIRYFKNNSDGISLINLQHALMKNIGVESFLEERFRNKDGLSINYIKLMYKCYSMASLDEIVTSRVKVAKTVESFKEKGINLTDEEKEIIESIIRNNKYPYIMFIGGGGNTKTIVYLEKIDQILVPLHSIRIDNGDDSLTVVLTREEIKEAVDKSEDSESINLHFLPGRYNIPNSGIEFKSGSPSTIIGRRD